MVRAGETRRWTGGAGGRSRAATPPADAADAGRGSDRGADRGAGRGSGSDGPGGAGTVGRRPALPRGRAVAGAFAVAVAVVLVFAAVAGARSRGGASWVVARAGLPAGARITAGDLTTAPLGLGAGPTAGSAFRSPADLVGRTVAVDVGAGQLILRSELAPPGSAASLRPVPVTVASADVVDLVAGDLVDVLVTPSSGHGTSVVLRGARVLAVSSPSQALSSSGQGDVVTIGVRTLAEAEALVGAEHAGTVDLIVGEASDGTGTGAGR